MFLWTNKEVKPIILFIPLVYSLIGILPLLIYGVLSELGLIIGGIIGFSAIIYRDIKLKKHNK